MGRGKDVSKSMMYNVVNPDDNCRKIWCRYAPPLRDVFGTAGSNPKPWDTNGIDGVHRFLRKVWNLFYREDMLAVTDDQPAKEALKSLHKLIKKVTYDIENFSFNTSVSAFMICLNELTALSCREREVLRDLTVCLAPFAPHLAEELWHALGSETSVCDAAWPVCNEEYLKEDAFPYAISFNGKSRFILEFAADAANEEIEKRCWNIPSRKSGWRAKHRKKVIIVRKKLSTWWYNNLPIMLMNKTSKPLSVKSLS